MKTSGSEERVPLGKIVGVHGLKGELKIYLYASGEEVADTVESLKSSRETVFIDGDGVIVFHKRGPMTFEEMKDQVEKLLK